MDRSLVHTHKLGRGFSEMHMVTYKCWDPDKMYVRNVMFTCEKLFDSFLAFNSGISIQY